MSTWWRSISELDEDQAKVIALPKNGDHLVLGPAGCGKTNLLLLRAAFLVKAGVPDVMVLAFGRVLKEFIVAGTSNYEIDHNRIQTYVRWGAQLLQGNGVPFDDTGDFATVRGNLLARLRELAELKIKSNVSDCILLDEAQDYSAEEIEVIAAFAKQLYAVGDDRQRVTKAVGGIDALRQRCGEPIHLTHHYRNGIRICRVADGIRNEIDTEDGMEATSKYDEDKFKSSVDAHSGLDLAAQCALVVDEVATQLFAYPDETIGILCPRQEDAAAVAAFLKASAIGEHVQAQSYAEGYRAFDPDRRVVVSTITSAKGLEFRAVHLLCMESVSKFGAAQKNLAFTGVTRAKTSLRVYHATSVPGYLQRGLTAAVGAPDEDFSLDDLFSKA